MFRNFIKVALRSLWLHKSASLINIVGLSIGLASCLLILLFVIHEKTYDSFHQYAGRIYRVYQYVIEGEKIERWAWTPVPMSSALRADYPEIQNTVRLVQADNILISSNQHFFDIKDALYTDSTFFDVFSFHLIQGDKSEVLSKPHSVVLTESLARSIFGNEDPVNELIRFNNDTTYFRITGITDDPPENSHFTYEMLISMDGFWNHKSTSWLNNCVNTYALVTAGSPPQQLEQKLYGMVKKYVGPEVQQVFGTPMDEMDKSGIRLEYRLQPLRDIHLDSDMVQSFKPSNHKKYIYIFSFIGAFIILIAGANFVNLSTSRSALRYRETGMRIILGSTQKKIMLQFLAESILITLISIGLAVLILILVLPYFNDLTGLSLNISRFNVMRWMPALLGCTIVIGILAGFYPAFLMSSVNTGTALKDMLKKGTRGALLRNVLVSSQYIIAIVILSGTLVVYRQLHFMQNKELGFDKDGILVIKKADRLGNQINSFIEELVKHPEIISISKSTDTPGFPVSDNGFQVEGGNEDKIFVMYTTWIDPYYLTTYKMKIIDGRGFMEDFRTDSAAIIINEAAVKKMGLKNPVGTRLIRPTGNGDHTYFTIAGVVKDFHFKSLHSVIEPYALLAMPRNFNWIPRLSVRYDKSNGIQAFHYIDEAWNRFTDGKPLEYRYLDDDLQTLYREEKQTKRLSVTFTVLAIFISCLGLLGLIWFTTAQRTKEIGIRKIMGASVRRLIAFLLYNTVRLVIISSVVAWPIAYYFLRNWLNDFTFRIKLSPVDFIIASAVILVISLTTIAGHIWYASTRNPVESLRYE
jgi:putative ABC transport system permease protein